MEPDETPYTLSPNLFFRVHPEEGLQAVVPHRAAESSIPLADAIVVAALNVFRHPTSLTRGAASLVAQTGCAEDDVRGLLTSLTEGGLLAPHDAAHLVVEHPAGAGAYFDAYASLGAQRAMLCDQPRTSAFQRAIARVVSPGDYVVDLGAGTGVLSMFAAKAGAGRVTAIEASAMASRAARLIANNGLADVVDVYCGRSEQFVPDRRVDVLVSEWIGNLVLYEQMFRSFVELRDRVAHPALRCVPTRVRTYLVPVEDPLVGRKSGAAFWAMMKQLYGLDFDALEAEEYRNQEVHFVDAAPHAYAMPPACVSDIDCQTAACGDFFFDADVTFEVERPAMIHGMLGYFELDLGGGVTLGTSPRDPVTHWGQGLLGVRPFAVDRGDSVRVAFKAHPDGASDLRAPRFSLDLDVRRAGSSSFTARYEYNRPA